MEAKDLQVGSLLQTEDGRIIDIDKIEKREGQFQVYNFKVEGFHTYFVSDLEILVHNVCGNDHLENLPMHPKRTRFSVKAGELAQDENLVPLHPVNPDQLLGSERVDHPVVQNLSNDDLIKFGGPKGDDPIRGSRQHKLNDDMRYPGSEIYIQGGHHRIHEIGQRVRAGQIDPETLIEVLIDEGY